MLRSTVIVFTLAVLVGCSGGGSGGGSEGDNSNQDTPSTGIDGVLRSKALIDVIMDEDGSFHVNENSPVPIKVVNPGNVKFTIDASKFKAPAITNALLDFGNIAISELFDNDLRSCGKNGKTKCKTAYLQVYTTGTAGAGLWNETDGYGMPITSRKSGGDAINVGLNIKGAAVMHTLAIADSKNVVRLSDFTPTANYNIRSDFTNAGAGTYATTLVIEYGLTE